MHVSAPCRIGEVPSDSCHWMPVWRRGSRSGSLRVVGQGTSSPRALRNLSSEKLRSSWMRTRRSGPVSRPPKTTASYRTVPLPPGRRGGPVGAPGGLPGRRAGDPCRDTGGKTWHETVRPGVHRRPRAAPAADRLLPDLAVRGPGGRRTEGHDVSRSAALVRIPADPPRRERQGRA